MLHCAAAWGALQSAGCALVALGAREDAAWALLQAVACRYLTDLVRRSARACARRLCVCMYVFVCVCTCVCVGVGVFA